MTLKSILAVLQNYYATELGRIVATAITIGLAVMITRLWGRFLLRTSNGQDASRTREKLVHAKNIVWVTMVFIVIAIWATKLAGLMLSLAAVGGAILLVSKELLMCILGYVMITTSRSYRVGDFIEIAGKEGRVIDIDVFTTTLAETGTAHQLTGKTLSMPNSAVLNQPVRNSSATGEYIVDLLPIVVPYDVDFEKAEKAALDAAEAATSGWQVKADAHLERIEGVEFVDLPSSQPKVLWQSTDSKSHTLVIRFACPMMKRVTAEQEIFRGFWQRYDVPRGRLLEKE